MKLVKSILLAFLISLFAACSGSSGSPESIAEAFVEKSYKGDADAVIAMIHMPDNFQKEAGAEELVNGKVKAGIAQQKNRADEMGGIDKITVLKFEPFPDDKDKGVVTVEITFKNGETEQDLVKVIHTENGWKVFL